MKITGERIVETALKNGATMAGIADIAALQAAPAYAVYGRMGEYDGVGSADGHASFSAHPVFTWPDWIKTVLVIGLSHPADQPELDWWDGRGTPGNRRLIAILEGTRQEIADQWQVRTQPLHYYVEKGGVFLKDAAVLAGLGCIGRSNLLVTPSHGPRIRLRAMFLDAAVAPTGPVAFDPCADCRMPCRKVCPEHAMDRIAPIFEAMSDGTDLPGRDGAYDRCLCNIQMEKDVAESGVGQGGGAVPVRYCRKCELACPVGKAGKGECGSFAARRNGSGGYAP